MDRKTLLLGVTLFLLIGLAAVGLAVFTKRASIRGSTNKDSGYDLNLLLT